MVRWELLGDVGVGVDGSRVVLSGQRTRAVAAYLVLHHGDRISNERLVDALWGEHPPKTARNSVQRFVADLRQALEPASHRLVTVDGDYRLELVPGDRIDAAELAEAITAARSLLRRGRADEALDRIAIGLDQMAGEPLGGIGDTEFGHAARARLDDIALDAIEVRLEAQLALGRFVDVAAEARSLADRYPYREMLWVHLMTGLYGSGRQRDALLAFQEVRQRLIDDLGVEPSATLRETERRVLAQDPELVPVAEASVLAPAAKRARLSVPATKFFGRERELDLVESLLTADEGTLVTIVGPGGSGKTRLADRAISRVEGRFDDGVVAIVELDGITDRPRVTSAVAAACGIQAAADPLAALVAHVQDRHALLVLDNAEEIAGAVSALAVTVMASAPRLSVLVTSREALGISAEHRIDITGLDLVVPPLRSATPAAALFTERARRLFAGFEPDAHVDRICALVGGLPLAIELAARWSSSMTPAQIADRLEHDVGLLVTDAHDVPERQRTMAGVLEATWSRLDPAQADLTSSLSIFVGGCDIDAAHAVCGASPLDLQRLVARSLLSWLPGGLLEMHELIRQYAAGRLDQDRSSTLRAAHSKHYLQLLRDGYATFIGPDPAAFIERLAADFDNVVAAWNTAAAHRDTAAMAAASETLAEFAIASGREVEVAALFQSAASLGPACFTAGMYTRRIRVLRHIEPADVIEDVYQRARALLPGPTSEEATGRVQLSIEFTRHLVERTNETERALQLIADARQELAQLGDSRYEARLDALEARAAMIAGRFDHAVELFERAINEFTDQGDAMRATDAVSLAGAYAEQGRVWDALQADLRALELKIRRRDVRALSVAHANTGASYMLVGAWGEAERHTLDAIDITDSLTDRSLMAYLDCQLAEVRVGQRRPAEAETLFVRGVGRLRHHQFALGLRLKLPEWARFLVDEQRWLEAGLVIDEARGLWEQVGGTHFQVLLDGLAARVCAGRGELDRAEMLARSAWECVRDTEGAGHPFPIRTLADCIAALQPCDGTHGLVVEIRAFATGLVERVLTSIEDPAYRKTYLTMSEVEYILS